MIRLFSFISNLGFRQKKLLLFILLLISMTAIVIAIQYRNQLQPEVTPTDKEQITQYNQRLIGNTSPAEINALAKSRQALLKKVIRQNPKDYFSLTLTPDKIYALPKETRSQFEKEVTTEGNLQAEFRDNFTSHTSSVAFSLQTSTQKYNLFFANPALAPKAGSRLKITASSLDNDLVVADKTSSISVIKPAAVTPGNRRIAAVIYNFQDANPSEDRNTVLNNLYNGTTSVTSYYKEVTFNKTQLVGNTNPNGDLYGWYTVPYNMPLSSSDCSNQYLWDASALNQATSQGFNSANYDIVIYGQVDSPYCFGYGSASGSDGKGRVYVPGVDRFTAIHEVGHLFGFGEADKLDCKDTTGNRTIISSNCADYRNGDRFEVMGSGPFYHFNAYYKALAGWIPAANVAAPTTSATYTLYPNEIASASLQLLKIQYKTGTDGTPYYYLVEFRQPSGVELNDPLSISGVYIRSVQSSQYSSTMLYDGTPANDWNDADFGAGTQLKDNVNNVTITIQSVSASSATIKVDIGGAACVHANPSITLGISQSTHPGVPANFSATLKNNDQNNGTNICPASNFTLGINSLNGLYFDQNPKYLLSAGETKIISFAVYSNNNLTAGNYSFYLILTNSDFPTYSINSSPTNLSITIDATDTTPPTGSFVINWSAWGNPDGISATKASNLQLYITANDDKSGVFYARFSNNNSTWTAWEPWNNNTSYGRMLYTWDLASSPGGSTTEGNRTIYLQLKNGNNLVSPSVTKQITYDYSPPTGTIILNDGAVSSKYSLVNVRANVVDLYTVVTYISLSCDNVTWPSFTPYQEVSGIDLEYSPGCAPGEGKRTVYARFADALGNTSPSLTDDIIFDKTGPTITFTVNNGAAQTSNPLVTLNITASDAGTSPDSIRFTNSNTCGTTCYSAWVTPVPTQMSWDLRTNGGTATPGAKTVYGEITDKSGNKTSFSDTIDLTVGVNITKSSSVSSAKSGENITYTLKITNPNAFAVTNISATDLVSPLATFVSASGGGRTRVLISGDTQLYWDKTVNASFASLSAGASLTVTYTVRIK